MNRLMYLYQMQSNGCVFYWCCGLSMKCPPHHNLTWSKLLGKAVEPLGCTASLEEAGHWGVTWSLYCLALLPVCFGFLNVDVL